MLKRAEAIATLVGMTVGAGILGIPYVIAQAGLFYGLINLIALALIVLLVQLYLGEVVLRTKGKHQLPGYASLYLGKKGKIFMLISTMIIQYGALIAYLIGESEVLSFIFLGKTTLFSELSFCLLFFFLVSFLVYKGIKTLGKGEIIGSLAIILIIVLIAAFFLPKANPSNFSSFNKELQLRWFFPYGTILFAYLGCAAIPEMKELLEKERKELKKCIVIGILLVFFIYALFSISVVGYKGLSTPEIATIALGKLACVFAFFTMFTSFLAVGIAQKEVLWYDLKLKHKKAWMLTCFPVLILALLIITLNLAGFVKILSVAGSIGGGLTGILIVLCTIKAKKLSQRKPEYSIRINPFIAFLLILLFVFGIAYQFIF